MYPISLHKKPDSSNALATPAIVFASREENPTLLVASLASCGTDKDRSAILPLQDDGVV
jgi:hypothetical protein